MRSNIDGAEGTQKEAKGGRGRTKGCAGVFLESYNSTKHNPRVNLTSPGGASWTPKKGTVEKKGGLERRRGRFYSRALDQRRRHVVARGRGMTGQRGIEIEEDKERSKERERKRERETERESSRTRFGASPIILQSSATTHRHFLPPQQRRR